MLHSCHKAINIKSQPFCQSDMTAEVLSELTQNVPLPKGQNMWFVHDGAAVRFSHDETQFYKTVCPKSMRRTKENVVVASAIS